MVDFIFKHQILSGIILGIIFFMILWTMFLMVLVKKNKDNVVSQYFQKHVYQKRFFLIILTPFMFFLFLLDLIPDIKDTIKEDTKNAIYYFKRAWKNK